jgi:hypothetical protein
MGFAAKQQLGLIKKTTFRPQTTCGWGTLATNHDFAGRAGGQR